MAPAIIPTATSTPSVRGEGRPHRVSQPFFLERYWQAHRTSLEAHSPVWRFVWPSQHSRGPLSKIIELKINKWQVRGPEDNCQQLWVGDKHRRQIWKGGRLDTAHWEAPAGADLARAKEEVWWLAASPRRDKQAIFPQDNWAPAVQSTKSAGGPTCP